MKNKIIVNIAILIFICILSVLSCHKHSLDLVDTKKTANITKDDIGHIIKTSEKIYSELIYNYDEERTPFIKIDSNSIQLLKLPYAKGLTSADIYSLVIFNKSHYEYNLGQIPALISFDKENPSNSKMLFPMDYCCKDQNEFIGQFIGKNIQEDTNIYTEIADMLLLTQVRHAYNCDKKRYNLGHSISRENNRINILTSYKNKCTDPFGNELKKKTQEFIIKRTISFSLKEDRITSIDYADWKK